MERIPKNLHAHFYYLIKQFNPSHQDELIQAQTEAIQKLSELTQSQKNEMFQDIQILIVQLFMKFDNEVEEKLAALYEDLKKSDNLEAKIALSIPLLELLGIKLDVKFDIKKWAKDMYKKYPIELIQLISQLPM